MLLGAQLIVAFVNCCFFSQNCCSAQQIVARRYNLAQQLISARNNVVGGGNRLELQYFYGTIRYILTHELYPNSGQTRCVLIVDWFTNCDINPVTGNPVVDPNRLEKDYTFLDDIYQIPVAVWPYNLLGADPATLPLGS